MSRRQALSPRLRAVLLTLACIAPGQGAMADTDERAPAEELKVTYVANEGFLLESGGRKVLVDALFGDYPLYIAIPDEVRSQVVEARGPFADVDLLLASHHHADHFDARAVVTHLLANPKATFVSTPQAVAKVREQKGYEKVSERVRGVYPMEGTRASFPELGLEVLNLHHGRDRKPLVENLGLLFRVGAFKVLQVGDTQLTRQELAATGLDMDGIDLAMVPDWLLIYDDWKGMVESIVRPKYLAAIHLQADYGPKDFERIRQASPQAVFFEKTMETRVFSK
ncbi:MAG: MBL fold metallo-hydrolase [Acidobacteria bacterium]|nr:MBL fold metallo-hydrolase [Acidobacteriota bacterium]